MWEECQAEARKRGPTCSAKSPVLATGEFYGENRAQPYGSGNRADCGSVFRYMMNHMMPGCPIKDSDIEIAEPVQPCWLIFNLWGRDRSVE